MRFKKIKSRSLTCLIILLFTTLLKAEKPPTSDNVNKPKKQKTVYYSTSPVDMNDGIQVGTLDIEGGDIAIKKFIGCHENKDYTPPASKTRMAMKKGALELTPFYNITGGFSFEKYIQPILDKNCISCHDGESKKSGKVLGDLTSTKVNDKFAGRAWLQSYLTLTGTTVGRGSKGQDSREILNWVSAQSRPSMLPAYHAGSGTSRIVEMLRNGHGGTKLTREELDKFCAWIDLCVPYCGDYMENNIWDEKTEKKYIHYHTKRESLAEENRRSTELLYKKRSGKTLKLQDPEPRYKNYFKKKKQAKWDELETIHKVEPYKPTPGTRNVALNPNAFAGGFPQVTTNNQYPKITNNGLFAANNIINGKTSNKGHGHNGLNGEHFPSWGPNVADNIWVKIDLGKKHEVDMVVIYIRADFSPYREGDHDSYFKSGTLEFSDGPKVPFKLKRNAKAQAIKFKARSTSSVKITDLVMAKRKWSGLSEVQVYGK